MKNRLLYISDAGPGLGFNLVQESHKSDYTAINNMKSEQDESNHFALHYEMINQAWYMKLLQIRRNL